MVDVKAIRKRVDEAKADLNLEAEVDDLLAEVARQAGEIERLQEALDECWVD